MLLNPILEQLLLMSNHHLLKSSFELSVSNDWFVLRNSLKTLLISDDAGLLQFCSASSIIISPSSSCKDLLVLVGFALGILPSLVRVFFKDLVLVFLLFGSKAGVDDFDVEADDDFGVVADDDDDDDDEVTTVVLVTAGVTVELIAEEVAGVVAGVVAGMVAELIDEVVAGADGVIVGADGVIAGATDEVAAGVTDEVAAGVTDDVVADDVASDEAGEVVAGNGASGEAGEVVAAEVVAVKSN